MGVISAVLGITLISGGTYAFFSSTETTNNTFAAGTLDLAVEPTKIIDVDSLKPGDSVTRNFVLKNTGSLDIEKVLLETDYHVIDAKGDNTKDFGKFIQVTFLYNADKMDKVLYKTTLAKLKGMSPEVVNENVFLPVLGEKGLDSETKDDLVVKFNFIDNGQKQNQFQGDSLSLEWKFNAQQG